MPDHTPAVPETTATPDEWIDAAMAGANPGCRGDAAFYLRNARPLIERDVRRAIVAQLRTEARDRYGDLTAASSLAAHAAYGVADVIEGDAYEMPATPADGDIEALARELAEIDGIPLEELIAPAQAKKRHVARELLRRRALMPSAIDPADGDIEALARPEPGVDAVGALARELARICARLGISDAEWGSLDEDERENLRTVAAELLRRRALPTLDRARELTQVFIAELGASGGSVPTDHVGRRLMAHAMRAALAELAGRDGTTTGWQAGFAAGQKRGADDRAGLVAALERIRELATGTHNPTAREMDTTAEKALTLHGGEHDEPAIPDGAAPINADTVNPGEQVWHHGAWRTVTRRAATHIVTLTADEGSTWTTDRVWVHGVKRDGGAV